MSDLQKDIRKGFLWVAGLILVNALLVYFIMQTVLSWLFILLTAVLTGLLLILLLLPRGRELLQNKWPKPDDKLIGPLLGATNGLIVATAIGAAGTGLTITYATVAAIGFSSLGTPKTPPRSIVANVKTALSDTIPRRPTATELSVSDVQRLQQHFRDEIENKGRDIRVHGLWDSLPSLPLPGDIAGPPAVVVPVKGATKYRPHNRLFLWRGLEDGRWTAKIEFGPGEDIKYLAYDPLFNPDTLPLRANETYYVLTINITDGGWAADTSQYPNGSCSDETPDCRFKHNSLMAVYIPEGSDNPDDVRYLRTYYTDQSDAGRGDARAAAKWVAQSSHKPCRSCGPWGWCSDGQH